MPQQITDIDPSKSIETTVQELQFPTRSLIILMGEFDAALNDQIRSIFSRVVAPVAFESNSLILDDARCSGCSPLIGQAALDQDKVPALMGIIGHDRAADDIAQNHDRILRLPAEWSGSTKYLFQIAAALAVDGADSKRVAALLFGGGEPEKKALLYCARHGWPLLVIGKTGGLADQIISAQTPGAVGGVPPAVDPVLREILETATIYAPSLEAKTDDLNRILMGRITSNAVSLVDTIKEAWSRYDDVDQTAVTKQHQFRRLQLALISLSVAAALFVILQAAHVLLPKYDGTLHILVVLTPILLSILAAYNSHFRDGSKWILLRGAAEAMKREIFRYRAQAGEYSDEQSFQTSRESKLVGKIKDITTSLGQSDVNKTSLETPPRAVQHDEAKRKEAELRQALRNSMLTPGEYLETRIQEQINYLKGKTAKLARQLTLMQWLIYVVGGAGTFLAAIKLDLWVALATAVVTALTTKLQGDQVETSLVQYNQALASLKNIEAWWKALSPWEKGRNANRDLLVDQTEKTLEAETAGWVQQMQSTLDKLTEKEQQPANK